MSSYYGLILVVLTFVSGLIWLIDALTAGKTRKQALAKLYQQTPEPAKEAIDAVTREPIHVDYAKSFFPILFFIVVLRSFLYEPFQIPSASMKPTFTEGDFILVNKFNYGLRLPVTSEKVIEIGLPERGDIAVFKAPHAPTVDYIKRVIGTPGDTVIYTRYKELFLIPACGSEVPKAECPKKIKISKELVDNGGYWDKDPKTGEGDKNQEFVEIINGVKHHILNNPARRESTKYYPAGRRFKVPEGHYFVMGDNRDNSHDGRYWPKFSFVPEEYLVGQAVSIWMHLDFEIQNKWFSWVPTGIDISRIGAVQ
jgi:signal peptidase I